MTPGPDPKPGEGEQASASDGSMEDILASIRRILAEDGGAGGPPAAAPPATTSPAEDVLDLTEQMLAPAPAVPGAAPMSAADIDALFNAPPAPPAQEEPAMADPPASQQPMSTAEIDALFDAPAPTPAPAPAPMPMASAALPAGEGLVGGAVAAAAAASFAALRAASRGSEADARAPMPDMLLGNGAATLEQIVRDELRPLLKAWLDANLPPLVERLVKAELERVARG
jgi:hypothetical protein